VPLGDALAESPEKSVSGWVDMPDGVHLVAAQAVGDTGLTVLVHQRAEALEPLAASVAAPVRRVGLVIAVTLVFFTGLITRAVMQRYESRLGVHNEVLEDEVRKRSTALLQTRDAVIFGLAKLADSRDRETGQHLERLQELVCLLARQLVGTHPEVDEAWIERLRLAAVLHDIGKVGIPDSILLKAGPLTPAERRIMQSHAELGDECLAAIDQRLGENDFLAMARDIAHYHHERWDGKGYPCGLRGVDIPLAARIVALADVYDAARSKRVYKPAQSHAVVREIILSNRGKHFDPAIVDAFVQVESLFERVRRDEEELEQSPSAAAALAPTPCEQELVSAGV
jgi:response regulator RpfG family c-di-GMP phosphodiesterase